MSKTVETRYVLDYITLLSRLNPTLLLCWGMEPAMKKIFELKHIGSYKIPKILKNDPKKKNPLILSSSLSV